VERLRAAGCVFAEDEAQLLMAAAATPSVLGQLVDHRANGTPLEHLLGWAQFCGRRIAVDAGVFVPRRRTEFLVTEAIDLAGSKSVVVDLCCGSGAVGAALSDRLPRIELHAVDVDATAVTCARRNLDDTAQVHHGDLYRPLPQRLRGHVDVLIANAPYVPTSEIALMPPEARLHEPHTALDGGPDGLAIQRRVVAGATEWLASAGHLLIETSERQAADTVAACRDAGLLARVARSADLDATVVIAQRTGDVRSHDSRTDPVPRG
jgi:release factor glutamine methyltransferase